MYTTVTLNHLQNHGGIEHSEENCQWIETRTLDNISRDLSKAIKENNGELKNIEKIAKKHGNIVSPPIYEFKESSDYFPPVVHKNNGVAQKLISLQRKICQEMDSKLCDIQSSDEGHAFDEKMETLQVDLAHKEASIKIINEEIIDWNEIDENTQIYKEILMNELREAEILKAHLKKMEVDRTNNMGPNEKTFKTNLKKLKVKGEAYFGFDNFVGNSMHKI